VEAICREDEGEVGQTDDDLTTINGKREQLVGKLQERYGMAKDQAESQIDEFTRRLSDADREAHKTRGA